MRTLRYVKWNSPKHSLYTKNRSSLSFHPKVSKSPSVETLQLLWRWQVPGVGNRQRFAVSCSFREGNGRLIRPRMKAEWEPLRLEYSNDGFDADAVGIFFLRTWCVKHQKHNKREPGLFNEEFRYTEMLFSCTKTYCCYDVTSNKCKINGKRCIKRVLEQNGDGPLKMYCRVLEKKTWIERQQTEVSTPTTMLFWHVDKL